MYDLNTEYFKEIDTKEKAYILGFIFADGGIARVNEVPYRLDISQKSNGRDVLEYIKECLGFSGPILYDQPSKLNGKIFYRDRLQISRKKFVSHLVNLGVVPNKSLILAAPSINNDFVGSFVRGYFDGDGSAGIYYRKDGVIVGNIQFDGTYNVLNWIRSFIGGPSLSTKSNIYRYQIRSLKQLSIALALMADSPFGMERKSKVLDKLAARCEQSNVKTPNNGGSLNSD